MAEDKPNPLTVRDFSKVQLTLENVLIPEEKLSPTPSMQDGLDFESEIDLRILGCELIQSAGILLRLPQARHCLKYGQIPFSWRCSVSIPMRNTPFIWLFHLIGDPHPKKTKNSRGGEVYDAEVERGGGVVEAKFWHM